MNLRIVSGNDITINPFRKFRFYYGIPNQWDSTNMSNIFPWHGF
ncbi:hypothetical protein LEP1GSC170_5482 [Leptospira interrogans serovar Bataviae str. HAI135]|nr:hypothetical protein LEP1GSC170_5482 [Leptospira interrogans serovar Bataviae str. HAI135]